MKSYALRDAFAAAQLSYAVLPAQAVQDDPDLLLSYAQKLVTV
jgi:hypothetical protein